MQRLRWLALPACITALGACGSSAKTASTPSAPTQASGSTQRAPSTSTAPAATATTPTGSSGGTEAAGARTATEPAFTSQPSSSESLGTATATLRARGFVPVNSSDYRPSQTLRVLVGKRAASSNAESAFFFINGRYIGTDAVDPSAKLAVVAQGDTEVTLAYSLYNLSDSSCCPGAGQAHVRFQLNNGKLVALDPIPPVHSSARPSRR